LDLVAVPVALTGKMFGRYQVLRPLAMGGMAEVLLARSVGVKGFERYVVIKRIRVENGDDQNAVEMFLDEARLVASLHHRNIVQVHDVGEEDGKYFFAMEYVHGEDARMLLKRVKDRKESVPIEQVITIGAAAAAGLHHAHEQLGPDREPLGIVHRDVSPGNILLGFDGAVKVVDFGIAKTKRTEETQAGEMKGKLGYMSPEQCKAKEIDRRTDIYLLGIVLYEMVTVRRLFKGVSRYETMAAIVGGEFPPPSKYRKDLPPELEAIIMKALATAPEDRYATADEMRIALEAFATKAGMQTSPSRLSDYVKKMFGERIEPWLIEAPPPPIDLDRLAAAEERSGSGRDSAPVLESGERAPTTGSGTPMAWPIAAGSARKRTWILGGLGAAAIIGVFAFAFTVSGSNDDDAGSSPPTPRAAAAPRDAGVVAPVAPDAEITEAVTAASDAGVADQPSDAGAASVATTSATRPGKKPGKQPGKKPGKKLADKKPIDTKPVETKPVDLDSPFPD
jgi:serine/threonine protein kinase